MSRRSSSTRGEKGRFTKGPSTEQDVFAVPRAHREIIPRQERSWVSSVFFTVFTGIQAKDQTEIDKANIYSSAKFFFWIVVVFCGITRFILWILLFLLLKNLILGDGVTIFVKTARDCVKLNEISCYERMNMAFFPYSKSFAWISFKMNATDLYARSLLAMEFALHLNNPVVLLGATITTAMTGLFLSYIHTFLSSTAKMARGAGHYALN